MDNLLLTTVNQMVYLQHRNYYDLKKNTKNKQCRVKTNVWWKNLLKLKNDETRSWTIELIKLAKYDKTYNIFVVLVFLRWV